MKNRIKKNNRTFIIRFILYILIMSSIILLIEATISSNEDGPVGWGYVYNGEIDVLIMGSSHAHYSIDAPYIADNSGKEVVILSCGWQNMEIVYFNLKEVIKYQHPDIIFIEAYSIINDAFKGGKSNDLNWIIRSDLDGMKPSINKYIAAVSLMGPECYTALETLRKDNLDKLCSFLKNPHKVKLEDVPLDPGRGFEPWENAGLISEEVFASRLDIEIDYEFSIPEENLKYLEKVIDICKDKQIHLEIIKTPVLSRSEYFSGLIALEKFLKQKKHDISLINLMDDKYGIELVKEDYYDTSHLSSVGARKLGVWFVEYLKEDYSSLE